MMNFGAERAARMGASGAGSNASGAVPGGDGMVVDTSPLSIPPALEQKLNASRESIWTRLGALRAAMDDREGALAAYEMVMRYNSNSVTAATQIGTIFNKREEYTKAIQYLQRAIANDPECGEAWAVLANSYVMTDNLQKAYQAYQKALETLPSANDPGLWYGIGLLYDRYGSVERSLEAFLAVLKIAPNFERADEVRFCIGLIYKEQQDYDRALQYFEEITRAEAPPPPLTKSDTLCQIGHVYELKNDNDRAALNYQRAVEDDPSNIRALQQYGWVTHLRGKSEEALKLLLRSLDAGGVGDPRAHYLIARVHMATGDHQSAYDALQQAILLDGSNALLWCTLGGLYYRISQHRDAMDAYSRAIRANPYLMEVWYNLGALYEINEQPQDAVDAYRKALELSKGSAKGEHIRQRLMAAEAAVNDSSVAAPSPDELAPMLPPASSNGNVVRPPVMAAAAGGAGASAAGGGLVGNGSVSGTGGAAPSGVMPVGVPNALSAGGGGVGLMGVAGVKSELPSASAAASSGGGGGGVVGGAGGEGSRTPVGGRKDGNAPDGWRTGGAAAKALAGSGLKNNAVNGASVDMNGGAGGKDAEGAARPGSGGAAGSGSPGGSSTGGGGGAGSGATGGGGGGGGHAGVAYGGVKAESAADAGVNAMSDGGDWMRRKSVSHRNSRKESPPSSLIPRAKVDN